MNTAEEQTETREPPDGPARVYARPAGSSRVARAARPDSAPVPPVNRAPLQPWTPAPAPGKNGAAAPTPARPGALPQAGPGKRPIILCFGATLLIYLALVPRIFLYSSPPTGDQAFYLMVTASIVEDRDLNIANNYAQRDEDKFYKLAPHPPGFVGIGAPYPLNQLLAFSTARPPTEKYDFRMPGLPLLVAPAWALGGLFALWWPATVVFMCLIGALVGVNMFLFAYELTGRVAIAWAVWLPLAFSNPVMSYSFLLFTELPTALFVLYAFRRLLRGWGANGLGRLALTGACIGAIPWMSWRCLPIALGLALYGAVQWWQAARAPQAGVPDRAGHNNPPFAWIAWLVPIAVSGGLLAWYNLFLFASIFPPSKVPELGDTSPFVWPWTGGPALQTFVTTGYALLFDRQMGLLPYAPIYLLAAVGMIAMFRFGRPWRRVLGWMAVVGLPYTGLIMSYLLWNGVWSPPSRLLTPLIPLLAGPLAVSLLALATSWLYKILYAALALPGLFLMAVMMYDPRLLWPGNPVLGWLVGAPESPLRFDARPFLPSFSPLDPLSLPWDTGWLTVASVLIVLTGWMLMARRGGLGSGLPLPFAAHGGLWIVALALIGTGWASMNFEYLKHKTALVQEQRWELAPPPVQALGLAYLDGTVFVADYRQGTLGALDTRTGVYRLLAPRSAAGPLGFAHPGDVKVGPDGLLYVLNNGDDAQALFVMHADGEVVREIALPGTSHIATGLSLAPDGRMYVSDMSRGFVFAYAPTGGPPLATLGGLAQGFNNVATVVGTAEGRVYISELGTGRIQEMDATGTFIRKYDLGCPSWGIAVRGDWLDATCPHDLWSINRQTGALQAARVAGADPQLDAPTGLTYSADGTLYVVDQHALIAYHVER